MQKMATLLLVLVAASQAGALRLGSMSQKKGIVDMFFKQVSCVCAVA